MLASRQLISRRALFQFGERPRKNLASVSFLSTSSADGEGEREKSKVNALLLKLGMDPSQLIAKEGMNRLLLIPAAVTNHVCLGSIFAWSVFNRPLTTIDGVVAQAATDWTLGQTSVTFSLVMGGFLWGGILGNLLERMGPRACCLVGAASLGSGCTLTTSSSFLLPHLHPRSL